MIAGDRTPQKPNSPRLGSQISRKECSHMIATDRRTILYSRDRVESSRGNIKQARCKHTKSNCYGKHFDRTITKLGVHMYDRRRSQTITDPTNRTWFYSYDHDRRQSQRGSDMIADGHREPGLTVHRYLGFQRLFIILALTDDRISFSCIELVAVVV